MRIFTAYFLPLIILVVAELLYFRIAVRFNIIDKPNERSSHSISTIRGGGIIFLVSFIMFYLSAGFQYSFFLAAVLLSGIVSFIDDIRPLPNLIKFSTHALSVIMLMQQSGILQSIHPLYLIINGILIIGVINAYNFMDGINGITGLYSIAVILPLFITEQHDSLKQLELLSLMALVVFNFFNARTKALCFAGDVGSIALAILMVYLIMMRIIETHNYLYIALLLVYGIDSVFTILQRFMQKENIFKPHRKHLYQYLSNEKKIPQLRVSISYAMVQFIISMCIVFNFINFDYTVILTLILTVFYFYLKMPSFKTE